MSGKFKTFDINPDGVQLDDQVISRPSYFSPMQWFTFWENVKGIDALEYELSCSEQKERDLNDEIDGLEDEISDLEAQIAELEGQVAELEATVSSLMENE